MNRNSLILAVIGPLAAATALSAASAASAGSEAHVASLPQILPTLVGTCNGGTATTIQTTVVNSTSDPGFVKVSVRIRNAGINQRWRVRVTENPALNQPPTFTGDIRSLGASQRVEFKILVPGAKGVNNFVTSAQNNSNAITCAVGAAS